MQASMLLGLFSWIGDFFKALFDLIPKVMYLLYASLACVIDVLQLFFRKLAGLDVYYVNGKAIQGDLVTNFITGILGINKDNLTYSALSTVFYSMIVFGLVICFISTLVAIIKSHYTYDEKSAKGPMQYIYTAGKAVINMIAVPIIVVLGLYINEALLNALDAITSTNSGTIVNMYGKENVDQYLTKTKSRTGEETYVFYDTFGFGSGILYGAGAGGSSGGWSGNEWQLNLISSRNETFSGSLFKVGGYNANRARKGQITIDSNYAGTKNSGFKLFQNAKTNDELADMIDTAFSCNLHTKQWFTLYGWDAFSSGKYFTNFLAIGTNAFSKFNIGLVWFYYDLWQFNFIVGFAGCLVCTTIFINIILGMMTRLFMCIVLFLVAPPLFGLAPLDGGKAGTNWRTEFMKQVLMTYGAVVGMNLMLMILPYMNSIDFFGFGIADYLARTLLIIVGLITIKAVIATLSGLIGAADANKTGEGISKEVAGVAAKAGKMTLGAAKVGAKAFGAAANVVTGGKAGKLMSKASDAASKLKDKAVDGFLNSNNGFIKGVRGLTLGKKGTEAMKEKRALQKLQEDKKSSELIKELGKNGGAVSDDLIRAKAKEAGLSATATDQIINARKNAGLGTSFDAAKVNQKMGGTYASYVNAAGKFDTKGINKQIKAQQNTYESAQAVYAASGRGRVGRHIGQTFKGAFSWASDAVTDVRGDFGDVLFNKEKKKAKAEIARQEGMLAAQQQIAQNTSRQASAAEAGNAHKGRQEFRQRWRDYKVGHGGADPSKDLQEKWRSELGLPAVDDEDMDVT